MGQAPASGDPSQRIHFLDVSRALFMLLGIPFHAALVYSSAIWAVSSPDKSAALEYLPTILSSFRMPGFFMIAGFFAALLLQRRSAADWLRMRIVRLGIPLLTGIAMIVLTCTGIGLIVTGIWATVDWIMIVCGAFRDERERPLRQWT